VESGTLTLTNLTSNITGASGLPDIQVTLELLSTDPVRATTRHQHAGEFDGSFTLYPLVANSSNITYYDLCDPRRRASLPSSSKQVADSAHRQQQHQHEHEHATPSTPTTTPTTTPTITTASTTSSDLTPITPTNLVSIGTLIPRAATTYTANIAAPAGSAAPAGAEVAFTRRCPIPGKCPCHRGKSIDPFNQNLANPQLLSTGTRDAGTYVSSGRYRHGGELPAA